MAHLRGFSFTDDSASVTAPSHWDGSSSAKQLFLRRLDPATQLIHFRQLQSTIYQKLFQSKRLLFDDTWPVMATAIQQMHLWVNSLSDRIRKPFRLVFRSEVLFTSILILSPTGLIGPSNDYGKFLTFEYAVEYAKRISLIVRDYENLAFYSSLEILRASFVAKCFLTLLINDHSLLFSGVTPQTPINQPPSLEFLTIPNRGIGEKLNIASSSLDLFETTLESLGSRYGSAEPLKDFKAESFGIRRSLQNFGKSLNRNPSLRQGHFDLSGPLSNVR